MSDLPFEVKNRISSCIKLIRNSSDPSIRSDSLKVLWTLTNNDSYKVAFCQPELEILDTFRFIFATQRDDRLSIRYTIYSLWYLSRELKNRPIIASEKENFIPALMSLVYDEEWNETILKIISNCVLTKETHSYLLSSQLGIFEYCSRQLRQPNVWTSYFYRFFANVATVVGNENVFHFQAFGIPQFVLQKLFFCGPNPSAWANRLNGTPYWCLNFLVAISNLQTAASYMQKTFLENDGIFLQYFLKLMEFRYMEGIKAGIVLSNLFPSKVLLSKYPHLNTGELFPLQLNFNPNDPGSELMISRGYAYGIIQLRDITKFLRNLSLVSENCLLLSTDFRILLPLVLSVIQNYVDNGPEYTAKYEIAVIYGGGGGNDEDSVIYLLEFLHQLCSVEENRGIIGLHKPQFLEVLSRLRQLSSSRISLETFEFANLLIKMVTSPLG